MKNKSTEKIVNDLTEKAFNSLDIYKNFPKDCLSIRYLSDEEMKMLNKKSHKSKYHS